LSISDEKTTWIFGCSSPLAQALLRNLPSNTNVMCFGRKRPDMPSAFIEIDFSQSDSVTSVLRQAYQQKVPNAVVFCQRYRPPPELSELVAIQQGVTVELGPLLNILSLVENDPKPTALRSIVLFSSVAGKQSHLDVSLNYQILKTATQSACRILANRLAPLGIRINCLTLGEFLKYPRNSYENDKIRQFSEIEKFSLDRRICNVYDISRTINFLLSDDAGFITGHDFTLDGGVSLLGAESLLRRAPRII
jgi:NAD(P)-dependent dehydrogenase (short-subunit alcohol dehydrogenase family)